MIKLARDGRIPIKHVAAIVCVDARQGLLDRAAPRCLGGSAARFKAALLLEPHAGFGERHRGRLLHEITKDARGSGGNDSGDKAGSDECTHRVSPDPHNFLAHFGTKGFSLFGVQVGRVNACVSTSMKVRPSEPTAACVKISCFGIFEIEKKSPDPRQMCEDCRVAFVDLHVLSFRQLYNKRDHAFMWEIGALKRVADLNQHRFRGQVDGSQMRADQFEIVGCQR
jgi:hypothetical protein